MNDKASAEYIAQFNFQHKNICLLSDFCYCDKIYFVHFRSIENSYNYLQFLTPRDE